HRVGRVGRSRPDPGPVDDPHDPGPAGRAGRSVPSGARHPTEPSEHPVTLARMVVPCSVSWGGPMSGEHFIPFRKADVVSMCADDLPAGERESFLGFTRMLSSLLHHRFQARIEAL